jgi:hypothetical protein
MVRYVDGVDQLARRLALVAFFASCTTTPPSPDPSPSASSTASAPAPPDLTDTVVVAQLQADVVRDAAREGPFSPPMTLHSVVGMLVVTFGKDVLLAAGTTLDSAGDFVAADAAPARVQLVTHVHGHWPDNAWAVGHPCIPIPGMMGSGCSPTSYRWDGSAWRVSEGPPGIGFAWSEGRTLMRCHRRDGVKQWVSGGGPFPEFSSIGEPPCRLEIHCLTATAVAAGHVVALGTLGATSSPLGALGCTHGRETYAIEVFAPDGRSRLVRLPEIAAPNGFSAHLVASQIAARAPDDVTIAGRVDFSPPWGANGSYHWPYVARFDGKAVAVTKSPPTRQLPSALAVDERSVWIVTSEDGREDTANGAPPRELWRREAEEPWQRLILPPELGAQPLSVAVDTTGSVWLSLVAPRHHYLLRVTAPR